FDSLGSVTAGNASSINDGAAAVMMMSETKARALGLPVLARIREYLQLKVLSMGRQKAVIKARREAKRVLRRDSRSHKQREEELVT
ncbi:hypothetical protein MJN47_28880, partial [Salmonella enterica subsp. enterica serovar Lubbock]|nr:hypothetical protein [Salmonella enterica subsp. enterica serovar Lubbock]